MTPTYDSTEDTLEHIHKVQQALSMMRGQLWGRASLHDQSKLQEPEKSLFDKYTPLLKETTYGSEQYKQYLREMGAALQHHYAVNSHHPEHHDNGVWGMDLLDLVEMFCDWYAASQRHADGSLEKSIPINAERFELAPQLVDIFENTRKVLGWK